ncbi:MAG: PAS domain-containing protein [Variovorax sp.]
MTERSERAAGVESGADAEISMLVERLHATDKRLDELLAGEVDTVVAKDGAIIVLRRAQRHMHLGELAKQAAILNALPEHIALLNSQGAIVAVNDAWLRSATANALRASKGGVGLNYLDICDAAIVDRVPDAQRLAADLRQLLDGSLGSFLLEYPCGAPGTERWFRLTATSLYNDAGGGAVLMHADITDEKRAADTLRHTAELLSAVVAGTPDYVFVKDLEGRYLLCNEAFARTAGRKVEDLIGKTSAEIFGARVGDVLTNTDRRVHEAEELVSSEDVVPGTNGERTFLTNKAPYRDAQGRIIGVFGISHDITDRKRVEIAHAQTLRDLNLDLEDRVLARTRELRLARDEAEHATQAKSSFLAAMTHEIRTPMNGVIGMLEVLALTRMDKRQDEMVELIRESAFTLLAIIDDVLDFSKIEAGKLAVEQAPMRIGVIVGKLHALLDVAARQRNVEMTVSVDPALDCWVLGDAGRLRQVLTNLIGNAIKFCSGQPVQGRVDVRASLAASDDRSIVVDLVVADNGIGMDQSTCERLFAPFEQADASTTRRFGGTGLGLAISHMLADLMGGTISVRSALGQGSTFTVRLPLARVDAKQASSIAHAPASVVKEPLAAVAAGDAVSPRVLLVAEDNETNRQLIGHQIRLIGHTAVFACDGEEALARWRSERHFDLLLTDLRMPEMDGYALAAAIRAEEPAGTRLPIIALTANGLGLEEQKCRDAGMDGYLIKPVRLEQLREVIAAHLPAARAPRVQ